MPFPNEPEILEARLAYSDAQRELAGIVEQRGVVRYSCGWYGSNVSDDRGSFAFVHETGPLADLVGDRVKLRYRDRTANIYVVNSMRVDGEYDLLIHRTVFLRLELLAIERIDVLVEVML